VTAFRALVKDTLVIPHALKLKAVATEGEPTPKQESVRREP
jgi:hypothetical protein